MAYCPRANSLKAKIWISARQSFASQSRRKRGLSETSGVPAPRSVSSLRLGKGPLALPGQELLHPPYLQVCAHSLANEFHSPEAAF